MYYMMLECTDKKVVDDMSKRLDNLEAAIQAGKSGDGK